MRAATFGALHEREFRFFFVGQTVSLLGSGMTLVALSFAILDLTGSATDVGFVFAAQGIAEAAFVLVGGVLGDRLSRRTVMISSDLVQLGTQGGTAALLLTGRARSCGSCSSSRRQRAQPRRASSRRHSACCRRSSARRGCSRQTRCGC